MRFKLTWKHRIPFIIIGGVLVIGLVAWSVGSRKSNASKSVSKQETNVKKTIIDTNINLSELSWEELIKRNRITIVRYIARVIGITTHDFVTHLREYGLRVINCNVQSWNHPRILRAIFVAGSEAYNALIDRAHKAITLRDERWYIYRAVICLKSQLYAAYYLSSKRLYVWPKLDEWLDMVEKILGQVGHRAVVCETDIETAKALRDCRHLLHKVRKNYEQYPDKLREIEREEDTIQNAVRGAVKNIIKQK